MSSRIERLVVRFSTEELLRVRARARASHSSVSGYIRNAALRRAPRVTDAGPFADLIQALNRVGLILNSVSANDGRETLVELQTVLRSAAARMRHPRRTSKALDDTLLE
jgi:hypothetical protein